MLIPLFLAAQFHGTFVVGDRTEVRARDTARDPSAPYFDVLTTPSGRLRYQSKRADFGLTYSPMLTMPDILRQVSPEVLHTAGASADFRVDRHFRFQISQDATYGDRNFGYLAPAGPGPGQAAAPAAQAAPGTTTPTLQLLPGLQTIRYGSSRSATSMQVYPTRHWNVGSTLSYLWSGGLDSQSRTVTPVQRGPRADIYLNHTPSRVDNVGINVDAYRVQFTNTRCSLLDPPDVLNCRPDLQFLEEHVYWSHRFERNTTASIGAGVSHGRVRTKTEDPYRVVHYPNAFISGTHTIKWKGRVVFGLDLHVSPVIDFRTGQADPRGQLTPSATWVHHRTTIRGAAGWVQSLQFGEQSAVTLLSWDTEVGYRVNPRFQLSSGVRATWQKQPGLESVFAQQAYVSATFESFPIRF